MLKYLSVCSGIEAASVAWHGMFQPVAYCEFDAFPSAVLAHHYPTVPNKGDLTKWRDWGEELLRETDLLVGGTPCQAFSIAGLRKSLDDDRGNLSLEYVRLADAIDDIRHAAGKPGAIILWENVPGVLSVSDNAFGCFLAALAGDVAPYVPPRGLKWTDAGVVDGPQRSVAWRILDAQYFGLAQRRRRVFVVASARDGFDPASVLLEWESMRRDSPPSREAGEGTARGVEFGPAGGRFTELNPTLDTRAHAGPIRNQLAGAVLQNNREVYPTLDTMMDRKWGSHQWVDNGMAVIQPVIMSSGQANAEIRDDGGAPSLTCLHEAPIVTHSLRADGFDASEDGTGRGTPLVPVTYSIMPQNSGRDYKAREVDVAQPLMAGGPVGGNQGGDYILSPIPFDTTQITSPANYSKPSAGDSCHPLAARAHPPATAYAFQARLARNGRGDMGDIVNALNAQSGQTGKGDAAPCVAVADTLSVGANQTTGIATEVAAVGSMAVRRLTPVECERLQGFPDGYTAIPWRGKSPADCPDGPRYKALGNSMAVPCMRWIGCRIYIQISKTLEGVK